MKKTNIFAMLSALIICTSCGSVQEPQTASEPVTTTAKITNITKIISFEKSR